MYMYFVRRTVALDLRGYGDSDKPKGLSNYTIATICGDIKAVIEHLSTLVFYQFPEGLHLLITFHLLFARS